MKMNNTPPKAISVPTKSISNIQAYSKITILPQSSTHVLIVWNISSDDELPFKAWQFKNEFGLDILLPNHVRSVILPIALLPKLHIQIFKLFDKGHSVLFTEYFGSNDEFHLQQASPLNRPSNSSLNNFNKNNSTI